MGANRNRKDRVKKIKTSRKPATKHLEKEDGGSTTILYGVGTSVPK